MSGFAAARIEAQRENEPYVCDFDEVAMRLDQSHCMDPNLAFGTLTTANDLFAAAEQALRTRHLDQALALFDQAEREGADNDRCAASRWTIHMLRGDFDRAWLESDAIRQRTSIDPHRMWQGEQLAGKRVIVRCLHGFGDAVQFLRYMPLLREIAAHVIVEVPPRLQALAACLDGVDEVITWGENAPAKLPVWDLQIEIMELPYIFRTQESKLPIHVQYLKLPLQTSPQPASCSGCLQVGLVWTAGEWNTTRSVSLATLRPLLDVQGCEFWNLQGCESNCAEKALLEDESCRDSVLGLAIRIASLDLVITVDTLAAHLAGAMGIPTWVMLQHEADWRWMHGREDSPWYPSLRLFRQPKSGDWNSIIESTTQALRKLALESPEPKMVA